MARTESQKDTRMAILLKLWTFLGLRLIIALIPTKKAVNWTINEDKIALLKVLFFKFQMEDLLTLSNNACNINHRSDKTFYIHSSHT